MGHPAQSHFLAQALNDKALKSMSSPQHLAVVSGAALEKESLKLISLLKIKGYRVLTTDVLPSEGVDVVWNLENSPPPAFNGNIDLFVCCSVLEHVENVHLASQNIANAMSKKGLIYISPLDLAIS